MRKIENIIFDFGGVLIDLDTSKTYNELSKYLDIPAHKIYQDNKKLFDDFEKGLIITENFFWNLQNLCKVVPDPLYLIKAWNAMILGWNPHKLAFLDEVKDQYNIYLLSNTNQVHIDHVRNDLKFNHNIHNFESRYFKKAYYSHEINMRKPDQEIFEFVIKDAQLDRDKTLFIDDNEDNIYAAREVGIHAHLHQINSDINLDEIITSIC